MSDFIQVFESEPLRTLDRRIRSKMLVEAPREALSTLFNYVRASVRFRAYRTGALLRSPEERFERGDLQARATLFTDLFYAKFVEFGTGQRGKQSGVKPPPGYVYGPAQGMTARRPFQLALRDARPEIVKVYRRKAKELN